MLFEARRFSSYASLLALGLFSGTFACKRQGQVSKAKEAEAELAPGTDVESDSDLLTFADTERFMPPAKPKGVTFGLLEETGSVAGSGSADGEATGAAAERTEELGAGEVQTVNVSRREVSASAEDAADLVEGDDEFADEIVAGSEALGSDLNRGLALAEGDLTSGKALPEVAGEVLTAIGNTQLSDFKKPSIGKLAKRLQKFAGKNGGKLIVDVWGAKVWDAIPDDMKFDEEKMCVGVPGKDGVPVIPTFARTEECRYACGHCTGSTGYLHKVLKGFVSYLDFATKGLATAKQTSAAASAQGQGKDRTTGLSVGGAFLVKIAGSILKATCAWMEMEGAVGADCAEKIAKGMGKYSSRFKQAGAKVKAAQKYAECADAVVEDLMFNVELFQTFFGSTGDELGYLALGASESLGFSIAYLKGVVDSCKDVPVIGPAVKKLADLVDKNIYVKIGAELIATTKEIANSALCTATTKSCLLSANYFSRGVSIAFPIDFESEGKKSKDFARVCCSCGSQGREVLYLGPNVDDEAEAETYCKIVGNESKTDKSNLQHLKNNCEPVTVLGSVCSLGRHVSTYDDEKGFETTREYQPYSRPILEKSGGVWKTKRTVTAGPTDPAGGPSYQKFKIGLVDKGNGKLEPEAIAFIEERKLEWYPLVYVKSGTPAKYNYDGAWETCDRDTGDFVPTISELHTLKSEVRKYFDDKIGGSYCVWSATRNRGPGFTETDVRMSVLDAKKRFLIGDRRLDSQREEPISEENCYAVCLVRPKT